MWEVGTTAATCLHELQGPGDRLRGLSIVPRAAASSAAPAAPAAAASRDWPLLVSASSNGTVACWDLARSTTAPVSTLQKEARFTCLATFGVTPAKLPTVALIAAVATPSAAPAIAAAAAAAPVPVAVVGRKRALADAARASAPALLLPSRPKPVAPPAAATAAAAAAVAVPRAVAKQQQREGVAADGVISFVSDKDLRPAGKKKRKHFIGAQK